MGWSLTQLTLGHNRHLLGMPANLPVRSIFLTLLNLLLHVDELEGMEGIFPEIFEEALVLLWVELTADVVTR